MSLSKTLMIGAALGMSCLTLGTAARADATLSTGSAHCDGQVGDGTGFVTCTPNEEVWFQKRYWFPRCANNTPYVFQVRAGSPEKLLIYLEQGGACWTRNTCVGSIAGIDGVSSHPSGPSGLAAPVPTYTPEVALGDGGVFTGLQRGIFAREDDPETPDVNEARENPFRDHTQVVVRYCSGDLHVGGSDCIYGEGDPICSATQSAGGTSEIPFPFRVLHRGYHNLNAVLAHLSEGYEDSPPEEVVVAGSSAGAYGVRFARAAVRKLWPGPRYFWQRPEVALSALLDSGVGVVDRSLFDQAFGGTELEGGVWGVEHRAPGFLKRALRKGLASDNPLAVPIELDAALARKWPYDRVGHYSSAFDLVGVLFLYISRFEQEPERWLTQGALFQLLDDPELFALAAEWSLSARATLLATSLRFNNKRYLGSGAGHVILTDPGDPRIPFTKNLYDEGSAGVPLTDWIDDMLDRGSNSRDWRNVSCFPFCEPPLGVNP